ncbi:MAG: GDYXXLXY domain-containing protein [Chitinophagaceae bacterium]
MSKTLLWPVFALVVLAHWWVPGSMIWNKEKVLTEGTTYKFQSAPVDPSDPFRGKYIVLNFREDHFKVAGKSNLSHHKRVYVTFITDKNGFARVRSVEERKPVRKDYLETTVRYKSEENDSSTIYLIYPFSTYYMEEFKAPQAERIYGKVRVDSTAKAYALVNLLNGDAVIKDVYINDTLLQQVINTRNAIR